MYLDNDKYIFLEYALEYLIDEKKDVRKIIIIIDIIFILNLISPCGSTS